jgi:glycogen phosphorylase
MSESVITGAASPDPGREELVIVLKAAIVRTLGDRLVKDAYNATSYDRFLCTAYAVAERMAEQWITTQQRYHRENPKRAYYLSMEYLPGRSLACNLINTGLYEICEQAVAELGYSLADLLEQEPDPGLGNGGLGRLASCFMDSLATLAYPAQGYGLRYDYGLFRQAIQHDEQVEEPDDWQALPYPWEVARPGMTYPVGFRGTVKRPAGAGPEMPSGWEPELLVYATPYDTPIVGYGNGVVNTLRLWGARAAEPFDLQHFNMGDYFSACEDQVVAENITKVLYPNDQPTEGRFLRMRQEHFLVSASLQDIVARFVRMNADWNTFPDKAAIQLNDTHPALAIPELLRILIDEHNIPFATAWDLTKRTFSYTNHTILPEALEEWPVWMLEEMMPRHMELIYLINHYFMKDVARAFPGDTERMQRMSIIAEDGEQRVRMAYLAMVGCHTANGVAALHTRLLQERLLSDFHDLWPTQIVNRTNGITPRRWLRAANPPLASLITEAIGPGWITDLEALRALEPLAGDRAFQARWWDVQQCSKTPIVAMLSHDLGISVTPESLFDVQAKRFHEYKRQLLFAFAIIAWYLRIKDSRTPDFAPRTCIISGKAAPGYWMAKQIIHFIARVADIVNADPAVDGLLKVAFLPNYRVSLAEQLIPAADLSEQISTAGQEASGTGNMKFMLNGALTIGTLDGANIEIRDAVGNDNIFIFGMTAEEVTALKRDVYNPREFMDASPMLQRIMHLIDTDFFSPGEPGHFRDIYTSLLYHDPYCMLADFESYLATQERAGRAFRDRDRWTRMSILNTARSGRFSSDRTIREYASGIWHVEPLLPDGAPLLNVPPF